MRPAMAGRPRGAPALLLSTSKAAPAALLPVLGSQVPGGRGAAGAQHRATKQGLELYGLHGKRLREPGLLGLERRWHLGSSPEYRAELRGAQHQGQRPWTQTGSQEAFFWGGKKLPQSRRLGVFAGLQEHPATTASTIALCFN